MEPACCIVVRRVMCKLIVITIKEIKEYKMIIIYYIFIYTVPIIWKDDGTRISNRDKLAVVVED